MWIKRIQIQKILNAVKTRPVTLLTGVRQVGKSSLLKELFPNAEYITLDRVETANEAKANPESFLRRFGKQVIIDEIQYAPILFRYLKILVDENRDETGRWILTGSQQFALMDGIKESLAGRVRILHLGSLNANELINAALLSNKKDLIWKGGFPEIWAKDLDVVDFYEDYIQTYLERDLKLILNVTNLRDFRRFLTLLAIRTGQLLKYSEIAKDVGVAVNTIKSWVNSLETSGIIMLLPPYYNNLGKRLIKAPKLYFCDTGLACALLNINNQQALQKSPHSGNIWENMVFIEFIKNNFIVGKNIFFYRDQNGVEIDFIVEHNGETYLIEAKEAELPDKRKLNFKKVTPLFNFNVNCVLACTINSKGLYQHEHYSVYNPLYGFNPFNND